MYYQKRRSVNQVTTLFAYIRIRTYPSVRVSNENENLLKKNYRLGISEIDD